MKNHRLVSILSCFAALASVASAADVTVSVQGGSLVVVGSAISDEVTIDQFGVANQKQFRVAPAAGTTVNGSASAQSFDDVTKDVRYSYPSGVHVVHLADARIQKSVRAAGGASGMMTMFLANVRVKGDVRGTTDGGRILFRVATSVVEGDCRIDGGADGDDITFGPSSELFGDVRMVGGGDGDIVLVDRSHVRGDVVMNGGDSGDSLAINESFVDGDVRMSDDPGADSCESLSSTIRGDLVVKLGAESDHLTLARSLMLGKIDYRAGDGDNELTVDNSAVTGTLRMASDAGYDAISLGNTSDFVSDVQLDLGDGGSQTSVDASCRGFRLTCGAGMDSIGMGPANFRGDVRIVTEPEGGANFSNVTIVQANLSRGLFVRCGDGPDDVLLGTIEIARRCVVSLGEGAHNFDVGSMRADRLDVSSGAGPDVFEIGNYSVIRGDLRARLGDGTNSLALASVSIGDDLIVRAGSGDDTLAQTFTTIVDDRDVDLGGGTNVGE